MDDKLLLLGLLRGQQMHGYQLYEYIDRVLAMCTDLKKPTAYYLLNRMAQDGWIEERSEQEGHRPPRKVYRLTQSGEEAFQQLLREALAGYQAPPTGDISLAFLDVLAPEEALNLLQARRRSIASSLEAVESAPQHTGSLQLLLDHQRHFLTGELAWMDGLIGRLANQTTLP